MSSSTSSTPQPVVIEAMEESKEIATESNNLRLGSPQEAIFTHQNQIRSTLVTFATNGSQPLKP
ncbi:BnaC02g39920D [Brassica napus]|uniref:BnaC02g39920D protein n=1 Tax=Brassica napus TaxID=3708 RepID=A0A078GI47_BRANA|nr:BnaC02g39920D [Brassica napus]